MRALLLGLLLALGAPLTVPTSFAQDPGAPPESSPYDWRGHLTFPDTVIIAAGQTLRVAPGTVIEGGGRLQVEGSLLVNGSSTEPVTFSLPVQLVGQGASSFHHTRFLAVNETALNVSSGSVVLDHATFTGNARALRIADGGRVELRDSNVTDHAGESIYAEGSATLLVERSAFLRNGRGIVVYSASRLDVVGSSFVSNEQHLVVDLWPWSVTGRFTLRDNAFLDPTPGGTPLPAIHLRHDTSLAPEQPRQVVELARNRIEGAAIGLRAEGRALVVESEDDVFARNELGVSVQLASVTLRRPTLDNVRDVEGTVVLVDAVTPAEDAPALAPAVVNDDAWIPWAIGASLLVAALVASALLWPRLSGRRAPERVVRTPVRPRERPSPTTTLGDDPPPGDDLPRADDVPHATDMPATADAAGRLPRAAASAPGARQAPRRVDLETPITGLERRILEDIVANPGTSQRAVADRLGYTRQALHYHVKRLEARGLLEKSIEGRETRCAVPAEVARALSTPAVTQTGSQEKG